MGERKVSEQLVIHMEKQKQAPNTVIPPLTHRHVLFKKDYRPKYKS